MFSVDCLIFDLDGTLCDTKDDIAHSVNLTLKDLGLPQKSEDVIYGYVGGGIRQLLRQSLDLEHPQAASTTITKGEVRSKEGAETREGQDRFSFAMKIFRRHYMNHLLDTTLPYSGMENVLNHFKEKKRALVTNKPQVYTDKILAGLNLAERFDMILGSDNGFPLKPNPEMILHVLKQLQVNPSRCVMIGDGLPDIEAARMAGIKACAVGYGLGDPDELKNAEPDFFCKRPEELTCLFD